MQTLGGRLRRWRFASGMTLAEASRQVEISKGYLSRIENGVSSPSIAVLNRLSAAYGAPLSKLLDTGEADSGISVVRADERLPLNRDGQEHGYQYSLINHRKGDRRAECFVVDMPPVDVDLPMFTHAGEEMFFVLAGRVQFIYGGVELILEAGDCAYFDASVEHRGVAYGGVAASALAVIVPPSAGTGQSAKEPQQAPKHTPEETKKCVS